ncbi:unnamed protein product [Amaranthus hypochondriacus]
MVSTCNFPLISTLVVLTIILAPIVAGSRSGSEVCAYGTSKVVICASQVVYQMVPMVVLLTTTVALITASGNGELAIIYAIRL